MKLINPSVERIHESDPFKKIEKVGRTCYKSEDKITEGSARKFYHGLVNRQHTAMVEHAVFVFQFGHAEDFYSLKSRAPKHLNFTDDYGRFLVSGNLRAINELGSFSLCRAVYDVDPELVYNDSVKEFIETCGIVKTARVVDFLTLPNITENEFMNHFYMTFLFITDRGVSHEIVRHREASYAQESTRYCNYVKAQFGGELTFIKPTGWDSLPDHIKFRYQSAWGWAEDEYARLISYGQTPQQARAVLPNALKTEIIMTACAGELEHFFDLRSRGTTGAPHPDIKTVADMALVLYEVEKISILGVE